MNECPSLAAVIVGGIDIVAQQIDLEKSPHIIIGKCLSLLLNYNYIN